MIKTSKNYKAFTLAETLITLVIIGVVAALTIPNIVANHRKEETVTRLKKFYSTISQTTNKAIADHGPIKTWDVENQKPKEFADKYLVPYLSIAKNCGYETEGDCRFEKAYLNNPNNKLVFNNESKLILADGSLISFELTKTEITFNNKTVPLSFAVVNVDINGHKDPNVFGKDIFSFQYWLQYDMTPFGGKDNSGKFSPNGGTIADGNTSRASLKSSSCNKNGNGVTCAALIMADDWQIKDDYPW